MKKPLLPLFTGLLLSLAVGGAFSSSIFAANTAAEIQLQRTLNAPIDLTLDKVELREAFDRIAKKANAPLVVDPDSYDCLPYGATTRVSATFTASPLRSSLDELLSHLGLEQTISGDKVVIRPTSALKYIGRRAEWEELILLEKIRTQQITKADFDFNSPEFRSATMGNPNMLVRIVNNDPAAHDKALSQVRALIPCTVAQALDTYASATNQIWTVHGPNIEVMPLKTWMQRQLERPIVINFNNAPLADVVEEISHLSRIRFQPEPGLYQAVPAVSVNSDNATVQKNLDIISGNLGISYELKDDAILLHLPKTNFAAAPSNPTAIVGRLVVPMGKDNSFDIFLRESDLPPELNELRKKKIAETIELLKKSLPATQPAASAPATAEK